MGTKLISEWVHINVVSTPPPPNANSFQAIHRESLRANSGSGGVAVISDCRRVLELLVPLSAKPAMKAGLLELKAVSALSKVMHRIVQRCGLRSMSQYCVRGVGSEVLGHFVSEAIV